MSEKYKIHITFSAKDDFKAIPYKADRRSLCGVALIKFLMSFLQAAV